MVFLGTDLNMLDHNNTQLCVGTNSSSNIVYLSCFFSSKTGLQIYDEDFYTLMEILFEKFLKKSSTEMHKNAIFWIFFFFKNFPRFSVHDEQYMQNQSTISQNWTHTTVYNPPNHEQQ